MPQISAAPKNADLSGVFSAPGSEKIAPKTLYEIYTQPMIERLGKELRERYPDFDPGHNDRHLRFLELLVGGTFSQEEVSGLPASMRRIEDAFNADVKRTRGDTSCRLYGALLSSGRGFGPWMKMTATRRMFLAMPGDSSVGIRNALLGLMRECPDDSFAPVLAMSLMPIPVPESSVEAQEDPWLKAMLRGFNCYSAAWKARGNDVASHVSAEGWKIFGEKLREACGHFEEADALRPEIPIAKRKLTEIAFLTHTGDPLKFARGAFAVCPDDSVVYSLQNYFLPRWGGSMMLEHALALERLKSAPADSFAAFQGVVAWLSFLEKDFTYREAQRMFPREMFKFFREKYEQADPKSRRRVRIAGDPDVFAAQAALAFRDYDFAEKIYRGNAEKFAGAGRYMRAARKPEALCFCWIDPEPYLREFSVGERRNELRTAWTELGRGNDDAAKKGFAKIIRDGNAPLAARQVALDIYWRAWVVQWRPFTFRESLTEYVLASCIYFCASRPYGEEFFEFLELAKCVPGELSASRKAQVGNGWGLELLMTGYKKFPNEQKIRVAEILSDSPEARPVIEKFLKQSASPRSDGE